MEGVSRRGRYVRRKREDKARTKQNGNTVRRRGLSAGRIKILNANEDVRVGWRAYTNTRLINGTKFHFKDNEGRYTRPGETREDKTRQNNTRQDMTSQDKTKQVIQLTRRE